MNDEFFTVYQERLENLIRSIRAEIEPLPDEAIDWIPGDDMNSIAVLVAHTAGSLRYWIGDVALDDPSGRVREREFQTRGVSPTELLSRLDAVMDYTRKNLPRLRFEDLALKRYAPARDEVITCGGALLLALEHGNLHLGHIQLTSQLWKQRVKPGIS